MSWFHATWLAVQYLRAHPGRLIILVGGMALAMGMPAFTLVAADYLENTLLDRAQDTPIILGHVGDEFDLTMSTLYFRGQVRDPIRSGEARDVVEAGYGLAAPLHTGHSAGGVPLIGTTPAYFEGRSLRIAQGRSVALLGEVVVGARAAATSGLQPGDNIRSDLTNLYNISGSYPLVLTVVGILAPSGTPDDKALFTDIKTTWAIDGYLHGHEAVDSSNALPPVSGADQDGENLEASAAIFLATEITDKNRSSFHLHGDQSELPASAVVVWPQDQRSLDQILGDWSLRSDQHAVRPERVVGTVLDIVLQLRDGLLAWFAVIAMSTTAFVGLVFSLSMRLREQELRLIRRLGAARGTIAWMVSAELGVILILALVAATGGVALGMTLLTAWIS